MQSQNVSDFVQTVQKQVEEIIVEHGSEKTETFQQRTIFHKILDSTLPTQEKTVDRLTDEGFVLIVAGGETTAIVLQNLIFFILSSPEWLDRIHKELDNLIPDPQTLATWQQLEALPCLICYITHFSYHTDSS